MRLELIVKYILRLNLIRFGLLFIYFLVFFSIECISQDYKLSFDKNNKLSEALLLSSKTYGFKVAFDAQRLNSIQINKIVKGNSIEEFMTSLLQNSGFSYIYKHGSYLIIENQSDTPKLQLSCRLSGSVIDSETGEQLPYASISIPEQNILLSTSTNGTFSLKDIISNPIHLIINYIGYYSTDTLIRWDTPNLLYTFKLKHKLNIIDSVNVKGKKMEMVEYNNDVDFSATINPSKLIDLPIMSETDIFKTLQLLPGISYSEVSSELSIRGGSSDQNLILFDGQTLYNISHFYGVFSSINPNVVKNIQVYKGGFDSKYGERISGIIDITGKSGNHVKPSMVADINLLNANLACEIPVSDKVTILAAARRSYSDIYSTPLSINLIEKKIPVQKNQEDKIIVVSKPQFHFYDYNAKISYKIKENENLSLSIYGGKDFFKNNYSVNTPSIHTSNTDSCTIFNYGASINWLKQWNYSFYSALSAGSSGYVNKSYNRTGIDRLVRGGEEERFLPDSQNIFETQNTNELRDYFISLQNNLAINDFNKINFGFLFRYNTIYYHKDADNIYIYDNSNQNSWLSSLFLQDRVLVFKNLNLKPGIRISYYNGNQQLYFEPRFALNYNFTEAFSGRLATGHYVQFISQANSAQETSYTKNFWVLANDSINPAIKANHYICGISYNLKNFLFDVEGYYKEYDGIQEYLFLSQFTRNTEFPNYFQPKPEHSAQSPTTSQPSYFLNGSGKTCGIDFLVRYKSSHFTSWISYTLSKSTQKYTMINSGEEIPSPNDQTHQISFSNLFTFGKWNIGSISLFSTGRPYVAFSQNENIIPVSRTYKRTPDYFRFDISANYNFNIRKVWFKTGFSIINLFNTNNYFDSNTRTYDFENSKFTETDLIQSQDLSLNLFLQIAF